MIVMAAPIKALMERAYVPRNEKTPNNIPKVAVAEAPEDTPRIKGSARWLRTKACMATPVMAKEAPTIIPNNTRGKRSPQTIFSSS